MDLVVGFGKVDDWKWDVVVVVVGCVWLVNECVLMVCVDDEDVFFFFMECGVEMYGNCVFVDVIFLLSDCNDFCG